MLALFGPALAGMVDALADDGDSPLAALPILPEAERRQLTAAPAQPVPSTTSAARPAVGRLVVRSTPANAMVVLNGTWSGRTPFTRLSVSVKISDGTANVENVSLEGSAVFLLTTFLAVHLPLLLATAVRPGLAHAHHRRGGPTARAPRS